MLCAISNAVPEDPVVDVRRGYVYEKALVEKYLQEQGKCPMTGEPLQKEDLLPLKAGRPSRPRLSATMSIPGLMSALHKEYDAAMLECHDLREQLSAARQELAASLYQHDAACRVITRVSRERDAAQRAMDDLRSQLGAAQAAAAAAPAGGDVEVGAKRPRQEEAPSGLSDAQLAAVEARHAELVAYRTNRNAAPEGLASAADVGELRLEANTPLHSTTAAGVLSVALPPGDGTAEPELVATGGADHTVQVLGLSDGVVKASLTGHAKKVSSVAFATPSTLLSASADKTVKLWTRDSDGGVWGARGETVSTFGAAVTRVCVHPVRSLALAVAADATWRLLDLEARRPLWDARLEASGALHAAAVHPDGNFFAAGGEAGGLLVVDVKTAGTLMSVSEGVSGAVRDVTFNENGFWVALACASGVQIWDLRKTKKALEVSPFDDGPVACAAFDHSGKYLACGGPTLKVYEVASKGKKKAANALKSVLDLPKKGVHALAFGPHARSLYVGAADHNLRKYVC